MHDFLIVYRKEGGDGDVDCIFTEWGLNTLISSKLDDNLTSHLDYMEESSMVITIKDPFEESLTICTINIEIERNMIILSEEKDYVIYNISVHKGIDMFLDEFDDAMEDLNEYINNIKL